MIPHVCQVAHNPPNSYGDCLRACVASLLDIERIEDVPHFMHDGDDFQGDYRFKVFLRGRGFRPLVMAMPGATPIAEIFGMMASVNTDIPYLLFCQCGGGDHVVICENDKMMHNPAWVKSPIDGPVVHDDNSLWVIMVLVKMIGE